MSKSERIMRAKQARQFHQASAQHGARINAIQRKMKPRANARAEIGLAPKYFGDRKTLTHATRALEHHAARNFAVKRRIAEGRKKWGTKA